MVPWVDSEGHERSVGQEFHLLDDGAQQLASNPSSTGHVAWRIGLLADDWERPASAKELGLTGSLGSASLHAIGSEQASRYRSEAVRLFHMLRHWLAPVGQPATAFVKDFFQDEGHHELLDIDGAARRHYFAGFEGSFQPAALVGLYSLTHTRELDSLLEQWWPSAAGMFGCLSLRSPRSAADGSAIVGRDELDAVAWLFETHSVFDNLGFKVLLKAPSWGSVAAALEGMGWVDGTPIDFLMDKWRD
jgi:hypothetical protein